MRQRQLKFKEIFPNRLSFRAWKSPLCAALVFAAYVFPTLNIQHSTAMSWKHANHVLHSAKTTTSGRGPPPRHPRDGRPALNHESDPSRPQSEEEAIIGRSAVRTESAGDIRPRRAQIAGALQHARPGPLDGDSAVGAGGVEGGPGRSTSESEVVPHERAHAVAARAISL